jgi:hypothetical protein
VPVGLEDALHPRHFWVDWIAVEGKAVADAAVWWQRGSKAPGGELLVGVVMLQHTPDRRNGVCIQLGGGEACCD